MIKHFVKSNRETYIPSFNVIDEMCDYKFDFNMVGNFVADSLNRSPHSRVKLKKVSSKGGEIQIDLDILEKSDSRHGHVLAVTQLREDGGLVKIDKRLKIISRNLCGDVAHGVFRVVYDLMKK